MLQRRVVTALGLLVAVAGTVSVPAHAAGPAHAPRGGPIAQTAPLTMVDWRNFTYSSACFSAHARPFVARNGAAQAGFIHFQVYQPIFGDITGDGQPEALVPYSCAGADFGGVHLYVFGGAAGQPRLLGEIPAPSAPAVGSLASVQTVTLPALTVLPQQRTLQVTGAGFSATATHTCPDLVVTLHYRVAQNHLSVVGSTVRHAAQCQSL